jgi:hypothetical protein
MTKKTLTLKLAPFFTDGVFTMKFHKDADSDSDYVWLDEQRDKNWGGASLAIAVSDIPRVQEFLNKVWMSLPGNRSLFPYLLSIQPNTTYRAELISVTNERLKAKTPKVVKTTKSRKKSK